LSHKKVLIFSFFLIFSISIFFALRKFTVTAEKFYYKSIPSTIKGFDINFSEPVIKLFPPTVFVSSLSAEQNNEKVFELGSCRINNPLRFLMDRTKVSILCKEGFLTEKILNSLVEKKSAEDPAEAPAETDDKKIDRKTKKEREISLYIENLNIEKEAVSINFNFEARAVKGEWFLSFKDNDPGNHLNSFELQFSTDKRIGKLRIDSLNIEKIIPFFNNFLISSIKEGTCNGNIDFTLSGDAVHLETDMSFNNLTVENNLIDNNPFEFPFMRLNGQVKHFFENKSIEVSDFKVYLGGIKGTLSAMISNDSKSFEFETGKTTINSIQTVITDDLFVGFDVDGTMDIALDYIHEKDSLPIIEITGNIDNPAQNSDRLDYLKTEFIYRKDVNNIRDVFIGPTNGYFVSFEELPEHLIWAVVTSEDAGFFRHHGVDFAEISAAAKDNVKRKKMRGGSTITQQIIKNLYLGKEQTLVRKFREMLLAVELDAALSKQRMLEIYFNIVEWAPNVFGIGEASIYFFNKAPWELSVLESVYLASIIPGPYLYHRYFLKNSISDKWIAGMHRTLDKLYEAQKITTEEYLEAMRGKIVFREIEREAAEEE